MSRFERLYSFCLCLVGLGCPLLRGSSDRRLRRCAATLTEKNSMKEYTFQLLLKMELPNTFTRSNYYLKRPFLLT